MIPFKSCSYTKREIVMKKKTIPFRENLLGGLKGLAHADLAKK